MSERECKDTIISAWNDVNKNKKENKPFKNDDWKTVAYQIQDESHFVTVRETGDMWIYSDSERVYIPNADTYVNEKSENLIYKCNTKSRNEIKNTIKSNGTMILARNFFDSTIINTQNCVLDPNTFEELTSLPGVGRKTANCVLAYTFGIPAIAVDIHVHRISNRLGWVKTNSPDETEEVLKKLIPKELWISVNKLLVGHGQTICKPINPSCDICPVRKYCEYGRNREK